MVINKSKLIHYKKLSEESENVFNLKEGTLYPILHELEEKG